VVSVTNPYGRILGFLDRYLYYSIPIYHDHTHLSTTLRPASRRHRPLSHQAETVSEKQNVAHHLAVQNALDMHCLLNVKIRLSQYQAMEAYRIVRC
jgi:hypothetical protein